MVLSQNKKINFNYYIIDKYEAGIKLRGSEIKSARLKQINIDDAYIVFTKARPTIINMNISKYEEANIFNHDPKRTRELLLHKNEINKLITRVKLEGLSIVPSKCYLKGSLLKIEICLVKGKKNYDKREDQKIKDTNKYIQKKLKGKY